MATSSLQSRNFTASADIIDINSDFHKFFYNLYQPQLLKHPAWLTALRMETTNTELFVFKPAEGLLYDLMKEVTHDSFLHFCNYLLFDRIREACHLKLIKTKCSIQILITEDSVNTLI